MEPGEAENQPLIVPGFDRGEAMASSNRGGGSSWSVGSSSAAAVVTRMAGKLCRTFVLRHLGPRCSSGSQLPHNLRLFLTSLSAGPFVVLVALGPPRASQQALLVSALLSAGGFRERAARWGGWVGSERACYQCPGTLCSQRSQWLKRHTMGRGPAMEILALGIPLFL
ncbi:unnamed protein product [Closterium sp. Yama58-4]|nr:unnamed protein product [Closterium sp. Yama58-4]